MSRSGGTNSSKNKILYARNIALNQICFFHPMSFYRILSEAIDVHGSPHPSFRIGETQSPCNQINKGDNCCWCFLNGPLQPLRKKERGQDKEAKGQWSMVHFRNLFFVHPPDWLRSFQNQHGPFLKGQSSSYLAPQNFGMCGRKMYELLKVSYSRP